MSKWRKSLAMVLTAAMLLSVLPVSTWAAESEPEPDDEVVFNLGTMDVTVGTDQARAEEGQEPYDLFQPDGSYTLELEPDAFFPYEVQFTHDGQTQQVWFMDPEDTVDVGGHTFSVESSVSDPAAITGMTFTAGNKTAVVYPEEKEFTNEGYSVDPGSLLPLKEVALNVNLEGLLPDELKAVEISAVLSGRNETGDFAVWAKGYDSDDYTVVSREAGTIDLSPDNKYSDHQYAEIIVGTNDQLDITNVRYRVSAQITPAEDILVPTVVSEQRSTIQVYDTYLWKRNKTQNILEIGVDPSAWQDGEKAYLSLNVADEFNKNNDLTATVYEGAYASEEEAIAANAAVVTDLWAQDLTTGGHLADYSYRDNYQGLPTVTVVLKRADAVVYTQAVSLYLYQDEMDMWPSQFVVVNDKGGYDNVGGSGSPRWNDDLEMQVYTKTVVAPYTADQTYYLRMEMNNPADKDYDRSDPYGMRFVQWAAVGDFKTAESIKAQPDIKSQLFSSPGYPADYSGGVVFSALATDGQVYQVKVIVQAREATAELPDAPRPDSQDTYFRMLSAGKQTESGKESLKYWVMPYGDDSYYYKGYQTVFLLNSKNGPVEAENIVPRFYTGDLVTMYAGLDQASGTEQKSDETAIPFTNGEPVHYSAAAESKGHLKNYWVTFLTQQTGGPKLFVNAANDPDRVDEETGLPVREVYLTPEYDYHHDVFFANIGDQNMTGVYVKLENAENVALDNYWTVREDAPENNRVLGAFDSVSDKAPDGSGIAHGELSNVAKVRLVPTEDSQGPISGTLVIGYGDGQDEKEVRIKLTGTSGPIKITTNSIVNGVKYVPYNSVIQTNSMDASDAIACSVTSGALPDGVTLFPNGKLYGMPTKAGEYTFTVKAAYTKDETLSDSKTFTITILDNTDANVAAATDKGYELKHPVPDVIEVTDKAGTYITEDQIFQSNGQLVEFVKFFLDGEELVQGTDYDAESGSTKITVRGQTLAKKGSGTHTLSAEFRTNKSDTNTVKRASQNYRISYKGGGSSGGGGGGSSSGTSKGFDAGVSQAPNGTITVTPKTAAKGKLVTVTVTPDAGYRLDKLTATGKNGDNLPLTDIGGGKYTFVMPTGGARVSGSFVKIIQAAEGQPFEDVPQGAWFVDAVKYVYQNGLMAGTSATTFSPYANTSRGMIVTVLHGMCGKPVFEGCVFSDVEEGTYYAKATCWASQNQIISGFGQGKFGPDEDVQREQLAVVMMRYAQYLGLETPERADLSGFVDTDQISAYAQEAMSWANAVGLLSGKGDGIMDPQGVATRAEVAAMMARLDQMVKQTEG